MYINSKKKKKKHINWNSWQRGNNIYLYIYIFLVGGWGENQWFIN